MKPSSTETRHQGLVNFSLSLLLLLLLVLLLLLSYSQAHLLSTRLLGNFQLVSHLSVFRWDCNLRSAYYVDLTDVTFIASFECKHDSTPTEMY